MLVARLLRLGENSPLVTAISYAAIVYFVAYCVAGLVVFARKVLRRDRPVQHTKLRVILLGLVCGMVPFLLAHAANNLGVNLPFASYLGFTVLLVPASFALAIMRYGALDTAFVVRVSLIYGLLTAAILAAYFLAVGVFGRKITETFAIDSELVAAIAIAACSLLVLPLRRRLQRLIDHAFYPSRRADRQALADLARSLADQMDADAAHELLLTRLHDLYRPRHLALLLAEGDAPLALRPARVLVDGGRTLVPHELPLSSPVARLLDRLRRPVFREEVEDALPAAVADPDGRALLARYDAALLVPLISGNQLLGVLVFGPKPDGSLYRQTDLANLSALALQAASLLRSLSLVNESLLRRQLETELAVARDIQAHLLPTVALSTSRFHVAGCMAPCRQVGGDYFDYFPLGNGALGVCIADVSGKGIPAALLMTTVRVAFRAEALPSRRPRGCRHGAEHPPAWSPLGCAVRELLLRRLRPAAEPARILQCRDGSAPSLPSRWTTGSAPQGWARARRRPRPRRTGGAPSPLPGETSCSPTPTASPTRPSRAPASSSTWSAWNCSPGAARTCRPTCCATGSSPPSRPSAAPRRRTTRP